MVAIVIYLPTIWLRSLPHDLTLRFHPYVGVQPLVLNDQSYKNPGGHGKFSIRDFQLFISNIVLNYPSSLIKEVESYHIIRFDGKTTFDEIIIPEIEINQLRKLSLSIGIDPKANGTLLISGDLDPNSRMAWNWQVGYKFLLLEGTLSIQDEKIPLVYHIGFDESYTELTFDISNKEISDGGVIDLKIDLLQLFKKAIISTENQTIQPSNTVINYLDMAEISHVKFAPDDVKKIANGFNYFISIL